MISLAALVLARNDTGRAPTNAELDSVPAFQWEVHFDELAPLCPSRIKPIRPKQRNALRIELMPSDEPRCSRLSPDGRGLAWLMSGGDPLSYGLCRCTTCPRASRGAA